MPPVDRNKPKRAASSESTYTVMDFLRDFPDDATCLDFLWRHLYSEDGQHADCPKCGKVRRFHRVASRPSYSCDSCGQHIHPTAGTIFHKSSTSLRHWFHAVFLMASTRCGVSAKQLERELGVTYKTAWRMLHRIRGLLYEDDEPLSGEVEADETYVDGKRKGKTGRPGAGDRKKAPVFGMVERGGKVVALTVENAKAATLMPHMQKRILPASTVYTDEWSSYAQLGRSGYRHERIHHGEGVYVAGTIHTNTIEGFWSLVKRGISGVHHAVSAKYLQGLLGRVRVEVHHRHDDYLMFKTLLENVRVDRALLAAD